MKILISTETYYPNISGAAIFSHDIAQKMVEKGHKVFVIAPSPKFTEYEEEIDGIKIFRVASKMNRFRNGYYVSKFPYFKVSKIIEHIRPDVIHIQDPLFLATSSLIKARKLKIPVVVTHHFSLEYVLSYLPYLKFIHPFIARILGGYLNWIYGKCDVLTCPTKVIAKNFQMIQTGTKIEVISNGVDTSQFMPYYADADLIRKKWKIPFQKPVILYVGRLDIDKDMKTYIKSIPFVLEKLDAHFVVVGDGTERKNLEELAGNLGVKDHTTFINFIPHNDSLLPKIYQTASLFVNPCPCETLSVAVLEAEATGLPIVAANSGALKEVVGNNKNGLLFQPKNHQDLAKKIITILKNESLAKKMGEESLKKVNNHLVKHTYNKF
jgi:glycosyltransferase involved in cell wall biosynthesis